MQGIYALRQGFDPHQEASEERGQQVQQTTEQCTMDLRAVRDQLEGLRAKIAAPTK